MSERLTKSFPVFDCDAHVNDPLDIWEKYVPASEKDLVRRAYWRTDSQAWLNGTTEVIGGGSGHFEGRINPVTIAGPQMNVKIIARLNAMSPLSAEQLDYLEHRGAYDARARVRDLDLMGIDQVLVIPTSLLGHLPYVEDAQAAAAFCRAYNNWLCDWCSEVPGRLYGAGILPLQSPELAARELERIAELGLPVALVRPIDARGAYPNDIGPQLLAGLAANSAKAGEALAKTLDRVFRTFEETGVCLGMHTFPELRSGRTAGPGLLSSPGELGAPGVDNQAYCFIFEAQTWLAQTLLAGFLDRYPKLKMLIFESNSSWLPALLDGCDRLFDLYANERGTGAQRRPSEAFRQQCAIGFESDEELMFRQWQLFEDIAIWASDCYHHDGADVWSAMRAMRDCGVPEPVQAKMLGGNARALYGIEPKLFVTEEPPRLERPAWFPQGPDFDEWRELMRDPRGNRERLAQRGWSRAFAAAPAKGR